MDTLITFHLIIMNICELQILQLKQLNQSLVQLTHLAARQISYV